MLMFFVSFVRRRRIQVGYPSLSPGRALGLESSEDLACGDQADNGNAAGFNRLPSTLLTVDQSEHAGYNAVCRTHGFNSAECRSASGNYVLYHSHAITLFEGSFDRFTRSVGLYFFSHRECSERMVGSSAGVADSIGDWIGTEGETANRIHFPSRLMERGERQRTDQRQALGTHRSQSCVDVIFRLLTGGEGKLTTLGGAFGKQ